jgi:hypothetical protein
MKKKTEKTIVRTSIFKLNAERMIICGPPAIWSAEVAIDVYFSDGTSEVQYISDIDYDYGDCGLQVATISLDDIPEDESIEPYLIAAYESEEEALASPYADSIKIFRNLFTQIAVI